MSVTEAPKGSFRLSQLIYDTRYRSLTIQVITMILVAVGIYWLIANLLANLSQLGQEPNFGFLSSRAGYDIGQTLIPYDNSMTHGRAALVGIMNTLLVAVLGCVTATILGVFAGVMRLSKNWVVAKLMAVYVEAFRNVPLVLWIVLIYAVFSEGMDPPNTFRPDADGIAQNEMLFGAIAITNQGTFIPGIAWSSLGWVFALVAVLSVAGVVYMRRRARAIQADTGRIVPTLWPSLGVLIVPLAITYLVTSFVSRGNEFVFVAVGAEQGMSLADYSAAVGRFDYCGIPSEVGPLNGRRFIAESEIDFRRREYFGDTDSFRGLAAGNCTVIAVPAGEAESLIADLEATPRWEQPIAVLTDVISEGQAIEVDRPAMTTSGIPRFEGGIQISNALIALWLALAVYTGAFIAEIVRAGILAVSKGQTEAAFALGMQPGRTMSLVILPQAMRVIIPPLISQFLNLTKNSSLAIAVGYPDVRATLGGITLNQTGRALECMLLLGLFYLAVSLLIAFVMNIYNNSTKLKER